MATKNNTITFSGSNLEKLQDLADSLYTKMGKTTYNWTYGDECVICDEAFNQVNAAINAVESSYSTGNSSKTCSTNYGTVRSPRTYTGTSYSTNDTVYSAVKNRVQSGYNFSNCTSFN